MIRASVVGATGYTGEEIVSLLAGHRQVKIGSLSAIIDKPADISDIFPRLKSRVAVVCKELDEKEVIEASDVVFLALPHTVSMKYAPVFLKAGKKVIDLSADYRLPAEIYAKWYGKEHSDAGNLKEAVYGLPELNRGKVKGCRLLANPGCYPTSAVLALAPLVKEGLVETEGIVIDSKSGITGAGRKAALPLIFGEISENFKAYKIGSHQHAPEIEDQLKRLAGKDVGLIFVPHVIPINRGILSTVYTRQKKKLTQEKAEKVYSDFYKDEYFVRFKGEDLPEIKDVVHTNFCDIGVKVAGDRVVVVSAIDNLTKGAAGQAVQNMNIMYGVDEKEGLL